VVASRHRDMAASDGNLPESRDCNGAWLDGVCDQYEPRSVGGIPVDASRWSRGSRNSIDVAYGFAGFATYCPGFRCCCEIGFHPRRTRSDRRGANANRDQELSQILIKVHHPQWFSGAIFVGASIIGTSRGTVLLRTIRRRLITMVRAVKILFEPRRIVRWFFHGELPRGKQQ